MSVRRWFPTVLMVALALTAVDCDRGRRSDKHRLALIVKTMSNPFFLAMERGAREAADSLGVDLLVLAPPRETDIDQQVAIVEDMIARRVDAILVAPAGSKEIVPSLIKANRRGIAVFNIDNRIDAEAMERSGLSVVCYIGADNQVGGRLAGEYLAKAIGGEGQVAMLEGIPGVDNAEARKRGFLTAVQAFTGIEIVASQTAHWLMDEGMDVTANILQAHPGLDGIFCANDMMALGAIQAIEAAGLTDKVRVTSYDNLEAAREAIRAGRIDATIEQHPELMGSYGVALAEKYLNGEKVPEEVLVPLEVIDRAGLSGSSP